MTKNILNIFLYKMASFVKPMKKGGSMCRKLLKKVHHLNSVADKVMKGCEV